MADGIAKYASKGTVTISLASLAGGAARQSTVVDNSTAGALDVIIRVTTRSSAADTGTLQVYAYTALGDTNYTDGATGSDSAFTAANRLNSRLVGAVQLNGTTEVDAHFSLAAAFGGVVPAKWGLIIVKPATPALDSTAGNHIVEYQNVTMTAV